MRINRDFKNTDANGNFKINQCHQNYRYDLESALAKHPIKELQNESYKEDLMNSLKKGNLQYAIFLKDGQELKQYIEATPQYKTLTVYDDNLKRLDTSQAKENARGDGQSAKQESKKQQDAATEEGNRKKNSAVKSSQCKPWKPKSLYQHSL